MEKKLGGDANTARSVASPASGHVGTCPPGVSDFFRYTLKQVVWFGLVLCQTLINSALLVQPYSLWNDTITGYNGACAKVKVVFAARRYAL